MCWQSLYLCFTSEAKFQDSFQAAEAAEVTRGVEEDISHLLGMERGNDSEVGL